MVLLKPPRNTLFIRLWSSFAFFYHNQLCCVLLWIGFGVIVVQGVREGSTIRFLCAQVTALYILPWKCCISINNGLFVLFFRVFSIKISCAASFAGLFWLSVEWNWCKGMVQFVFSVHSDHPVYSSLNKYCISINIAQFLLFFWLFSILCCMLWWVGLGISWTWSCGFWLFSWNWKLDIVVSEKHTVVKSFWWCTSHIFTVIYWSNVCYIYALLHRYPHLQVSTSVL